MHKDAAATVIYFYVCSAMDRFAALVVRFLSTVCLKEEIDVAALTLS